MPSRGMRTHGLRDSSRYGVLSRCQTFSGDAKRTPGSTDDGHADGESLPSKPRRVTASHAYPAGSTGASGARISVTTRSSARPTMARAAAGDAHLARRATAA